MTTLDVVSDGRAMFGIGASWLEAEWEAVGLDFATRGRRVDEAIAVCQQLWSEPVVEHHGEFFDFGPVMFEPKPVQKPWPPIHIGGDGPAALRRAATVGDGWIPMNHTVEQIPADAARIAALREKAGRPGTVEITMGVAADLDGLRQAAATPAWVGLWCDRGPREARPSTACAGSPTRCSRTPRCWKWPLWPESAVGRSDGRDPGEVLPEDDLPVEVAPGDG